MTDVCSVLARAVRLRSAENDAFLLWQSGVNLVASCSLSTNAVLDGQDTPLRSQSRNQALAVGGSYQVTNTVTTPAKAAELLSHRQGGRPERCL